MTKRSGYVVLAQEALATTDDHGAEFTATVWTEEGTSSAGSPEAAIREVAGEKPGIYVAVPARSWAPRQLAIVTQEVLRLVDRT